MAKLKRVRSKEYDRLQQLVADVDKEKLKVGFFESATYEDGTPVAYVASIQEFGDESKNIPPRSFMRTTASEKQQEWSQVMGQGVSNVIHGGQTVNNVLEQLGLLASGQVAEKIASITTPPLKASTIEARRRKMANGGDIGSLDKPLVESALLFNSVAHIVE